MNKNVPPPPRIWPDGFDQATPNLGEIRQRQNAQRKVRVVPIQQVVHPQPPANVKNRLVNRPIVLNNPPAVLNQARRQGKKIFKLALVVISVILLTIITISIIQSNKSVPYYPETSKSETTDRLLRAIDKFLKK